MEITVTNDEVKSNIAERLSAMMARRGFTQATLAKKCDESEMNISRFIHGKNVPNSASLSRLADALDVSTDYLLGRNSRYGQKTA